MGANVLIINNYRDADADRAVGKRTLCVIIGRRATRLLYLLNALTAMLLTMPLWAQLPPAALAVPILYAAGTIAVWLRIPRLSGHALTPLLAATSMLMLLYCGGYFICALSTI